MIRGLAAQPSLVAQTIPTNSSEGGFDWIATGTDASLPRRGNFATAKLSKRRVPGLFLRLVLFSGPPSLPPTPDRRPPPSHGESYRFCTHLGSPFVNPS